MKTTETGEVIQQALPSWPTLRLLYSGNAIAARTVRALQTGMTSIGREVAEAEGIGLPEDARLSRVHAIVHTDATGASVCIRDHESKNGTFINGCRVSKGPLRDGDILRVGDSFLMLRYQPARPTDAPIDSMIGSAPVVCALRCTLQRIAPSAATVLLLGESGTGKEIAARALHECSGRSGPFKAFNCSAITESLAESQLFGHVKGAFTGASAHDGWFRSAHGGTLFLDEIGDLPQHIQPMMLRALEERAVVPVGATSPMPCDVRLCAATNRDLLGDVQANRFRGDLYARLAEYPLRLPPLRERREDILPLFLHAFGLPVPRLSPRLVDALLLHPWPFNVRELFKFTARLRLNNEGGDVLDLAENTLPMPPSVSAGFALCDEPAITTEAQVHPRPSCEELAELLRVHKGKISRIATAVGRSRRQVDRWLEEYHLDAERFRG